MQLLISDANILIDMDDSGLLSSLFKLPYEFVTPDVLFEEELKEKFVYSSLEFADIGHLFVKFDIQKTIVSSVGTIKQDVLHELE